ILAPVCVSPEQKYKDVESSLKIKEVDGLELVRKFSEDMETMLRRKVEAVQNLVEAAEEADLNHEFNESLVFDYYNSVLLNEKDSSGAYVELGAEFLLEANAHFSDLLVNTTLSSVQLPTNVYNKDPDILNGIYMSEALNAVFVENFQRDPTLTWQYFGSSTGFFRIYPGIKWTPDENGVITFDCRNRGWYIQAATSPKDIVIVVDTSGSMKGLRMTIAKHTVSTILDTLGENDFVNIIAYNDYIHYIEPCFKGILVQADRDNREHFKQLVDELMVKGVGVVDRALREAFQILQQFQEAGQGSLCNQAIMLITDGAVEDYEPVLEKYNWPDRKVRVFTYLIGREVSFADRLKWIACNNKGYYTQISTLADAQENVMEYLHVLSRPMVINHDHDITWTEAYIDSKAQSLALLTTVAMPVFSKKNETRSHGILLGVVGSDVALRELMKLAPRYKLGVHGYAFLNTNNGYILSHPDLRPLYREGKKLKPKPNYNSVDLSEVEWEDQAGMVTCVLCSACSLGVVLSRGHGEYILLGNTSVEEGLHDLLHPDLSLAGDWIYCITDIDPEHRKLSQLEAVVRFLTQEDPALECDPREIDRRTWLWEGPVDPPQRLPWPSVMPPALSAHSESEQVVDMAFLGTRAGLLRSSLFVGSEKVSDKFLTPADEDSMFTLDHFPLWYRQAAEHPPGSMVFNLRSAEGPGKPCPELHGQGIPPPPRDTRQPSRSRGPLPTGLHPHPGWVISFPGQQSTMPFKMSKKAWEYPRPPGRVSRGGRSGEKGRRAAGSQLGVEACPPSKVPGAGEAQAPPTAALQMPSRPSSRRVTVCLSTRSSSGVHGLFLHRESLRLTRTTQLGGEGHRARVSLHFTVRKAVVGQEAGCDPSEHPREAPSLVEPKPRGHLLLPMGLEREVREVLRGSGVAPCPTPKDDRLPPVHIVTRTGLLVALGGRGQEGGGRS
uniref:VWFA domain-containing protein n=1 Tax=Bos indicus x Bos taurus TaxID=30522 RepID=A0A4W2CLQ4_BOBOX